MPGQPVTRRSPYDHLLASLPGTGELYIKAVFDGSPDACDVGSLQHAHETTRFEMSRETLGRAPPAND